MSKRISRTWFFVAFLCTNLWFSPIYGQNKVNITSVTPSSVHLCADPEWFEINVRNITTSTVSGISSEVILPTGMQYVKSSLSGGSVSESDVSNLQKPVFGLPDLKLATSVTFKIQITAACGMISFLANGGLAQVKVETIYSGGKTNHVATPLNILQPAIRISQVTNQFATSDLGSYVTRVITIFNGGKGKIGQVEFQQINESGLKLIGYSGGDRTSSGDTAWSSFDKKHFSQVGNKDNFLDQTEWVFIYDTLLVTGCTDLKSYYSLEWGCNAEQCASDFASATVTISTRSPKLVFTPKSATTICAANSNAHLQELLITNSGNDTARKVEINIFQGVNNGYYQYELSRIDEFDIQLKVGSGSFQKITAKSKTSTYTSGAYACLGSRAIGAVVLDLPDLPPGGTAHITWKSISCCTDACGLNFYAHRWKYKSSYVNQCGTTISPVEAWGSYGKRQVFTVSGYAPSDVVNNQDIQLNFRIANAALLKQASNAEMTMHLKLPAGLSHSGSAGDFVIENDANQSWQPSTIFQSNDTVFAIFRGAPKFSLTRSEIKIKVTGDCSSSSTNAQKSYGLDILYNPDQNCKDACTYLLYCFSSTIRIHCDKACSSGFKFSEFEAKRITYGLPDNNNDGEPDSTGTIDLSKIKQERVMFGDTLQTTFRGRINAVGSTTTWRYLKASSTIDRGYYMKVADVRLKIYRSGSLLYSCNGIAHTYSNSGFSRTFTFDVGVSALISAKCPLYSGFTFGIKDSVELEIKYVYDINPGGVIREVNLTNEMYLSTVSNPAPYQRYQCDTFGGKFVMIGYYYSNYGRNSYSTNSCNEFEVTQGYYLSVGSCCSNYAGNNIFPYEYRNWSQLDKASVILPKGFEIVSARFYQYRTIGTGKTAWQYTDSLQPIYNSGDTIVYDIKSLHLKGGGKLIPSDDGFYGYFYYKLQANCLAKQGNSRVNYQFMMSQQNYLGNEIDTVNSPATSDILVYEKPDITLIAEQNDIKAKSDTAIWNIRLSNASYISKAEFVWLSYRANGNTRITEIRNRATGQVIKPNNDIFQMGNLAASQTLNLEVKAVFDQCGKDSFELLAGFNCTGYPDSLAQYPCAPLYLYLSYTPVNSRLSAVLNDSLITVALCQKVFYEVNITNEGEARIFELYLDLILREGMILSDTAWAFEPGTNDSFAVVGYSSMGNSTFRYSISPFSTKLKDKGLPGFTSGLSNTLTFKFALQTNCDFVSSSYFLLKPGGELRCGKSVITSYGIGKPINIMGVSKPYFSSFTMEMGPLDVCNFNGKMRFKFINLGPDTTGPKDKIQLLLPDGLYVDTSYLKEFYRAPISAPVITNSGRYKAEWSIPDSTLPGDSSFFEINTFVVPSEIGCGYTQIIGQAIVKQPALCVVDSSICNIDVATSSDLILDSVQKSDYTLSFISGISTPSGNKEFVSMSYSISNMGTIKRAGTLLQVKYIDDVNGNMRQDAGEQVVYADTIWQELDRDSSLILSANVLLDPVQTCRLLLLVDSTNCLCDMTALQIPPIRVVNAGRDTIACSLTDIPIGTPSLPGCKYSWQPTMGIDLTDSSKAIFNYVNPGTKVSPYIRILATNKGSCTTYDSVTINLFPSMKLNLPEEYMLCKTDSVIIGDIVQGGVGFKSYQWLPVYGISKPTSLKVWAKPEVSTMYTIEITDAEGCRLFDSTKVTVVDRPRADFTFKDTCAKELFAFYDNTSLGSSGLDSVHWAFGIQENSTATDPAIFIDSAQILNVRYFVQDSIGCTHDTTKFVTAFPLPVVNFIPHNDCELDSVNLFNQSTIEYGSFTSTWLVDGVQISTSDLLYTFKNAGLYPVELKEISDRGCISKLTETLEIYAKPNIVISTSDVCHTDSSFFSFANTNGNDSIADVYWDLGNGTTSASPSTGEQYADTGTYAIGIEIGTKFGCRDTSTATHTVHILPIADFVVTDVCLADTSAILSRSTIGKGNINSYRYDLGSGFFNGSDSLYHVFTSPGFYPIRHVVISDAGCIDSVSDISQVHYREKPNLQIAGNCQMEPIDLRFNPTNSDSLQSVQWVINTNDTLYGTDVIHPFLTSGNQEIKLKLQTKWNCVTDTSYALFIDPKPDASFTINLPCLDNYVEFRNTSVSSSGSFVLYDWDLGDGTLRNTLDVDHTYPATGTYPVQLIVENTYGCRDTTSLNSDITYIVVPDFDLVPACALDSAQFTHTSRGLPTPPTFSFNLGDGNFVYDTPSFNHAYLSDGTYPVLLTLTTSANCTYDTTKFIDIYPLPLPGFDIDPPVTDILNSDVQVIDNSSGASSYFYWLSDGNSYDTPNFTHHFSDSGTYVIRQILTTNRGCVDSIERYVTIGYIVNILIPNAFSPNVDNINETFGPGGLGLINYDLSIYNRWGELVYKTDSGIPWNGEDAQLGVYYYALKMIDYKHQIHYAYGQVLLNR